MLSTTPRREREKAQRRQDILAAAERVFAVHGFEGASIEKIAQEAEYAVGTIYLYFKDKLALYASLIAHKLPVMADQVEKAAAETPDDPVAGLRNAIRAQFEFHDQQREFFGVFFRERKGPPPVESEDWIIIEEAKARHHATIIGLISKAQSRKLIRKGDTHDLACALLGIIIHLTHESMESGGGGEPLINKADFVFDFFMKGAARPQ